jgi:hypothetical protein
MGSSVWTGVIDEFGLAAEGVGSVGVDIVVMFFLPGTIPRVPSMGIATASGDMPCGSVPDVVFRVKPLNGFVATQGRKWGESNFVFLIPRLFRGHMELLVLCVPLAIF